MTATTNEPRLVRRMEAARMLGIGATSMWALEKAGRLRPVRIGRAVCYDVRDLDRFVAARKREATRGRRA